MSAITIPKIRPSIPPDPVTPEDLLKMDGLFELVDGQLVEKKMSYAANKTAGKLIIALGIYAGPKGLGDILPEQSFQCFPDNPSQVRRPDIAFIVASRVPPTLPKGHVKLVPDLAVEVVSPNDVIYELDEKLADYRSAAIPLVWVINPESRVVRVYRLGKPIDQLFDGDLLSGDPVLPGFSVNVTDLFPAPSTVVETTGNPQ